jgi:Rrf2 family protein
MRLSSMADYAVLTMTAAARRCGQSAGQSLGQAANDSLAQPASQFAARTGAARKATLFSAAQLAEETGLPAPTVQKLVSRLTAAGLLHSSRGAGGGLRLARPAAAITLADIIEAVEGPIALASCVDEGRHDCTLEAACTLKPHWPGVNAVMRSALAGVSLIQLASGQPLPHQVPA